MDISNMHNPTAGMSKGDLGAYRFTKSFPTRDNCNLKDPREMFLWCLVALPGVNGAQLTAPISYNMAVSEHLYECGARLVEEPTKKWIPPAATSPHWLTSPGRWVPLDHPVAEGHPADVALSKLTQQQKAELFERLKRMHENGDMG